jgi:uncharacterized repeat protein (TIGR01451 family)
MIVGRQGGSVRAGGVLVLALCVLLGSGGSARAVVSGTGWEVATSSFPTNLHPGGSGNLEIDIFNTGAKPSSGSITVTDTLPPGLTAVEAGGMAEAGPSILSREEEELEFGAARWACSGATVVTCTTNPAALPSLPFGAGTGFRSGGERLGIKVNVAPGTSGAVPNHVAISGGGAAEATSVTRPVTISSSEPGFGFPQFDGWFTNADGTPDTQAGSHPYEATFFLGLNELANKRMAGGEARNVEVDLPPGLFGDPNAVPQCTRAQLDGQQCPAQSQIGIDTVGQASTSTSSPPGHLSFITLAVYNMVPPPGIPNEFAFSIAGKHAFFDAGVRSGHGYGLVEHTNNIPQVPFFNSNVLTLWGVPADPAHDRERDAESNGTVECREGCSSGIIPKPFLTLPTSCVGPQTFTVRGLATWSQPSTDVEASFVTHDNTDTPTGFTGCEHLSVDPSLSVSPDTSFSDTPAGFNVDVTIPQETLTLPDALVSSTIKDTVVTLPEGVVINPGQGAGLAACQEAEANVHGEGPSSCPAASKVGTVHIRTPLLEGELENELEGNVYVLQSNPPNLQLLLAASGDGIYLKLVGDVHLNERTGQLTTTFAETPALPFTHLKLSFSGGGQAALDTPTGCGSFTSTSDFTPWTSPAAEDLFPSSSFAIVAGPGGSACSSPMPFSPSMIAGSTTDQAGGFTNFSLLLQRDDGQQRIQNLQFKTPEGLLGMISKVPLCGEPQASQGTCSAASQIGHTVVAAGPGPYPLVVPQPGKPPAPIYLTGGYKGAPYGLSIVVPVVAGPFDLGTVVVRAKVEVDPLTTELTVTTDALPTILDGIPADLRTINAVIDRPGFMFNPTNCEPQAFSGTATSVEGVKAPLSSHFQMGSCRALTFKPNFKVSTSGKTSRPNGASLDAKILYPTGALGANQASSQSNVKSVKVDLPKQLPSRLTTLQKACTAATFEVNPAACPAASKVGQASASTPVLPVQLTGPAYFVSYGGAKFPELVIALQGYGVTVYLHGETFISKTGITSSTFRKVPDVPITSFDLNLPQGKFSALAANGNLCKMKLKMPTVFTAQDGAVIHQSTPISVTGCAKAKVKGKKAGAHHKSHKRKK